MHSDEKNVFYVNYHFGNKWEFWMAENYWVVVVVVVNIISAILMLPKVIIAWILINSFFFSCHKMLLLFVPNKPEYFYDLVEKIYSSGFCWFNQILFAYLTKKLLIFFFSFTLGNVMHVTNLFARSISHDQRISIYFLLKYWTYF